MFGISRGDIYWSDNVHYLTKTPSGAADFAGWSVRYLPMVGATAFGGVLTRTRQCCQASLCPGVEPSRHSSS